jgi:hypothetical protein
VFVWQRLDNGTSEGPNRLVKLAIRILSIIANSGGCERSFSDFGITHTKRRNRLAAEKVHKTSIVKTDLRRAHTAAGLTSKRRKRAFGQDDVPSHEQSPDPSSADSQLLVADEDLDVRDLMNELIRDANEDANDNGDNYIIPTQAVPPASQSRTTAQRRISLALLFSFADPSSATSLEFYWKGGLKNMQRETAAYDMMHDEEAAELPAGISTSSTDQRDSNVADPGVCSQ